MKLFAVGLLALTFTWLPASGKAQSETGLSVKDGYIYVPLKGSTMTAGYGTLLNTSGRDLKVSVVTAEGFKAVELHETITKNGLMKMQKIQETQLKGQGSMELKPGGSHIMLFDPNRELEPGDVIQVSFHVDNKTVSLPFTIRSRAEAR